MIAINCGHLTAGVCSRCAPCAIELAPVLEQLRQEATRIARLLTQAMNEATARGEELPAEVALAGGYAAGLARRLGAEAGEISGAEVTRG